jgi:hypothetical protein
VDGLVIVGRTSVDDEGEKDRLRDDASENGNRLVKRWMRLSLKGENDTKQQRTTKRVKVKW